MTWRVGALAREAWRNVVNNAVRSMAVALIAGAAIGVLGSLELRTTADLAAFERDYAAAGGYVAVVTGQQGGVDAGRCARLREWPAVVAAGAVRVTGTVSFVSAAGVLFQSAAVTEGALRVWAPSRRAAPLDGGASYVSGRAFAKELGLREGSYTALVGEPAATLRTVIDAERRNPQVQRWLLDVVPPVGLADECWVELRRESYAPGIASLAAWFSSGSSEAVVRPYTRRDEFTRDPLREFRDRPQRFGWVAAGGLIAAVFLLSAWFRRAELGLYLALGTGRLQVVSMLAVEAALLVGVGVLLAVPWVAAIQVSLGHDIPWEHARIALRTSLLGALLGLGIAPWLAALVARGNIANLLKDR